MESPGGIIDEDTVSDLDCVGGIGDIAVEMAECISIGNAKVCCSPIAANRSHIKFHRLLWGICGLTIIVSTV